MNPPSPPKNILVYLKFKRQRGFSLWIDCLDLLCFYAVTRSPRLNGGCVAPWGLSPSGTVQSPGSLCV